MAIQFKLKTLIVVVLTAAVGLAVYDHFYPFNRLREGSTCSISDAAECAQADSFRVNLNDAFIGVLECEYISPTLSYGPEDRPISLNAAHINSRPLGRQLEPKLELCDFSHSDESYSSVTTLVKKLPSLAELQSFTTVSHYVDRLGPQRGYSDGWTHGWLIFTITNDKEIEVASIFLHHGLGNHTDPELVFRRGVLKTSTK